MDRAYLAAQEILGSLTVASEQVAADTEHKVEEVEVKCYDSDSLSSPPPSSEESDKDIDPLLDFSRDDDLTHHPGTAGPAMVRRAIEAQRALEGMRSITQGVQEKRQREEEKSQLVSTQTEFIPMFSKSKNVKRHPVAKQGDSQPPKETTQQVQAEKQPTEITQQLHRVTPEASQHSPPPIFHHSLPPPIPPYSPETPDSFLLSNKPEYHHSVSTKQEKLAQQVDKEVKEGGMILKTGTRTSAPLNVALRAKKRAAEKLPTPEQEGHVADRERKQKSFVPQVVQTATEVTDIYEEAACQGLPESGERVCRFTGLVHVIHSTFVSFLVHVWRKEEVEVWLKQLSPILYELYLPCFAKHDITGMHHYCVKHLHLGITTY